MGNKVTIRQLMEKTTELQELFRKVESKPWNIDTYVIELLAEVGTLADSILIKEGYRNIRPDQKPIDLEDSISDILFVIFMIADYYEIDVGRSYLSMVENTQKKLEVKINQRYTE